MKELVKVIEKRIFIWSMAVNMVYSIAYYGESFILSYFGTSPLTVDKLVFLAVGFFIVRFAMLITGKLGSYIDSVNTTKTETAIEIHYFNKLQSMTMKQITNVHTGYIHKLISKVSMDFFEVIWEIEASVIPLIIGGILVFAMLCRQSIITGILCIIISSIAVFIKYNMIKNKQTYQNKANELEAKYNATFIDFIQNIITVRKLNIANFCNNKIIQNSNEYLEATKTNEKKRSMTNGVFTGLMDLLYLVTIISTILVVKSGGDGLPYLLFYITALGKLYSNLNRFGIFIYSIEKFKITKKQLDDYFKDNKETILLSEFNNVRLENAIFSYTKDGAKIKIPEFTLNKGDRISIIGESGQGKTTTMNILAGLYQIENGNLLVDNKICNNCRLDVVFVSQEVELFDLSIRDNLCLGKNVPEETIMNLLEEAGLLEWYKELPDGLDTLVGEKGIKLSAGQKQRLNLIRGILIDKDLYFFDEPTSNLDILSEEKITNMIEKYLKDKTYVIVTHRPKIKELCNRHYKFENHMLKEIINL